MEQLARIAGFILVVCLALGHVLGQGENLTFQRVSLNGLNFSVSDQQLPWAQAVNACVAINQTLATVDNPEKDDTLVQLFVERKDDNNVTLKGNTWIAATEIREGVWTWNTTGKPIYYYRWFMDGQPDDTENLNCVYMASEALLYWRDANCSASMYFVCEGELPSGDDDDNASPKLRQSYFLISLCGIVSYYFSK